jgi:hypothetical protein
MKHSERTQGKDCSHARVAGSRQTFCDCENAFCRGCQSARIFRCRDCGDTFAHHPNPDVQAEEASRARERNRVAQEQQRAAAWEIARISAAGGRLLRGARSRITFLRMSRKGNLLLRLVDGRELIYRPNRFRELLDHLRRINADGARADPPWWIDGEEGRV